MKNKLLIVLMAISLGGCASKLTVSKNLNYVPGERILKVAVLPLDSRSKDGFEVRDQVREEITANLQEGNYELAEISQVDSKLKALNLEESAALKQALAQRRVNFKEALGVDLVVTGEIKEWTKTYLALHSDVELDVELKVYDAQKGTLLSTIRKGVIKSSGISRVPTGYISAGTSPILGLRKSVQQQVIHNLTREISEPLIALNSGE